MVIRKNISLMKILLILSFAFLGCSDQDLRIFSSTKEVKELKQEVDRLKSKIVGLENSNKYLGQEIWLLKFKVGKYESCYLDQKSKSYQRLDTNTGTFLISLEDVIQDTEGCKLIMNIGNPYVAQFVGFKLLIKWGKRISKENNYADFEEWQKSISEKEVSFSETLLPASWNKVELTISPAIKEEIGYLELSMTTDVISLIGNR
jgi:hypothetical protein